MDINILREAVTVVSFTVFIGIVWWAWSGSSKKGFDEAARLPFEEIDDISGGTSDTHGAGARR